MRKRRRRGDLARVAEIVMVLAAAGEARGGRKPTAPERALAAQARSRLASLVAAARPRELYPTEAVRALVEDLGLFARLRDPAAVGYRPHRPSIADRILLTKRKMEESKISPLRSTANVPQATTKSSAASVFQHGAASSNKSAAAASFPVTTPAPVAMAASSAFLKQNISPGVTLAKPTNVPSIVSLLLAGSANVKVEKGVRLPNFTPGGATIGQANTSAHPTATRSGQSTVQSSSSPAKSQEKKPPFIQPVTGNTVTRHQVPPPGATSAQHEPCFSHHNAIAKSVQHVMHQPASHLSWTVPSTEYIHARLDCQICKTSTTDVESLLVCDACERGAHLECLQHHGNEGLPNAEWYCPTCLVYSKGKPLPPRYGKVARTTVAPEAASLTSGRTCQVEV